MRRSSKIKKGKEQKNSINITSMNPGKADWKENIYQFILVWIGVYASLFCFAGGIGLDFNSLKLNVAILFTLACYFAIFYFKKYIHITTPVVILLTAGLFFRYRDLLIQGFYHTENTIIKNLNAYYRLTLYQFIADNSVKETSLTVLLILILQLLALVFSVTIYLGRLKYIAYLLMAAFTAIPFVFGNVPETFPMLLVFLFVILIVSKELAPEYKWKIGLYSAAVFGCLMLLSALFFTPGKFTETEPFRLNTKNMIRDKILEIDIASTLSHIRDDLTDFLVSDSRRIFNFNTGKGDVYFGGLSGGKLATHGEIKFSNETALKLTIPSTTETIYLKGFVGAYYSNALWKDLTDNQEAQYQALLYAYGNETLNGQNQTPSFLDLFLNGSIAVNSLRRETNKEEMQSAGIFPLVKSRMDINYFKVNLDYLYLPYVTLKTEHVDVVEASDSYYLPIGDNTAYSVEYYGLSSMQLYNMLLYLADGIGTNFYVKDQDAYEGYITFERAYSDFVHDVYAKRPNNVERLASFAESNFSLPMQPLSDMNIMKNRDVWDYRARETMKRVQEVTNYLNTYTTYSLNPGKLPADKDFAEYFLFDNYKGFCAHYATTAVLMLRSLGIPARYVEGYIVTKLDVLDGIPGGEGYHTEYTLGDYEANEDIQENMAHEMVTVEIKDTNAHSWVEVYFDGFGWIPLEVTAGYSPYGAQDDINSQIKEKTENIPTPTRLPTNTPTPTATPKDHLTEGDVKQTPIPTKGANPTIKTSGDEIEKDTGSYSFREKPFFLLLIITIIIVFILLSIRYLVLKHYKKRKLKRGSNSHRVLLLYQEIEQMIWYISIRKKEEIEYMKFAEIAARYDQIPKDFPEIMAIVLKSKFGNTLITEEELNRVFLCYLSIRKAVSWELSDRKIRFWVKYILVL